MSAAQPYELIGPSHPFVRAARRLVRSELRAEARRARRAAAAVEDGSAGWDGPVVTRRRRIHPGGSLGGA